MSEEAKAVAGNTIGGVFGEAVALLVASPKHRDLSISDLEWILIPAIALKQFRIFRKEGRQPVGVALWGYLDAESEVRLEKTGKLRPADWKSGDRLWLVELISPMGGSSAMLVNLKQTVFAGKKFRYHIMDDDGRRRVVEDGGDTVNEAGTDG